MGRMEVRRARSPKSHACASTAYNMAHIGLPVIYNIRHIGSFLCHIGGACEGLGKGENSNLLFISACMFTRRSLALLPLAIDLHSDTCRVVLCQS